MFTIMTNPTAIGAQGSVNNANNTLSKTIQQLSTGLRINSSADDASGMAVSEKLRGQISGLKMAARNAQDGISFLQTAESNMGTMTSMVQRIRELAVQAGDPAYTASDRVMLQTEVDQLKNEVDRVSTSAEFNTKKLLNGDAAALWSGTGGIDAIVKGSTIQGNYNLEASLDPGTNNVYKSNVMAIGTDQIAFNLNNTTGISRFDNMTGMMRVANPNNVNNVQVNQAIVNAGNNKTMLGGTGAFANGGTGILNGNFLTAGIATSAVATSINTSIVGGGQIGTSINTAYNIGTLNDGILVSSAGRTFTIQLGTSASTSLITLDIGGVTFAGSVTRAGLATFTVSAVNSGKSLLAGSNISISYATVQTTSATIRIVKPGVVIGAGTGGTSGKSVRDQNSSYTVEFEMTSEKTSASASTLRFRVRDGVTGALSEWKNSDINATGVLTSNGNVTVGGKVITAFTAGTTLFAADQKAKNGDKLLIGVQGVHNAVLTGPAGNLQFRNGSGATTANAYSPNGLGAGRLYNEMVSTTANQKLKYYTAQMDSSGKVSYGSMDVVMDKRGTAANGNAKAKVMLAGDTASSFTKLSQIARFTNADGRMVLDNPRDVTIYGNGKQAIITLDKSMTIADLEKAMSSAIVDQLGMGAVGTGAGTVNNNLVNYVYGTANATSNGVLAGSNQAMEGTFVIQTAMLGNASSLSFSADQGVLDALNIGQIQTAKESSLTVNVRNAHTGDLLNTTVSSDGIAKNVVKNVDVKFNMANEANMNWNSATRTLQFIQKPQASIQKLHLVNNATIAAIGANEGQTLDVSIGRMDTTSLNIADVNVLTVASSQKAITQLDQALDTINKGRAVVGAQMNRLNYTINNLNVSRENMMAAESRIRDLDIAEASTNLAAQQVRLQAATAMLAQANQLPSYAAQLLR